MSTPLSSSVFDAPRSVANHGKRLPPDLWREPLLHFLLLGALLFAVDHFLIGRADDPRTIIVGAAVDNEARELFKASRNREPTKEEMEALRRVWLDNEVLYREGLALQLDKGDPVIRERVIFKALSTVEAGVKLATIDDKQLRSWFDSHRVKYDDPMRFDFEEAALPGNAAESTVRAFVDELNHGAPGDSKAGLRVFSHRPLSNLQQSYGDEFAVALQKAPVKQWQAMQTRDGWRAIRLDGITPPSPGSYDALRNIILQDWKDATASEQRSAAVRAMQKKYTVKYESAIR